MAFRLPLAILTAYFIIALAAASFVGELEYFLARLPLWFAAYLTLFGVAYLVCGLLFWLMIALVREIRANGKNAGLNAVAARLRDDLRRGHILRAVYLGLLFCLVSTVFTSYKPLVGSSGFSWDVFFAQLDSSLHAGRAPWEWLHAHIKGGFAAQLLDVVYKAFFLVVTLCVMVFGFFPIVDALRQRFLLGLLIVIPLAGSFLARGFASAGPIYYDRAATSADPFVKLRECLAEINAAAPLDSVELQSMLWRGHETFSLGAIGVSAFPSVHIAVLTLCALAAAQISKIFSLFLWFWTFLTVIATIYLGWHYAIDAYASIVFVLLLWKLLLLLPLERQAPLKARQ